LDPVEYEYLFKLEDDLWWFVGQRRIADTLLRRHIKPTGAMRVLDAGCGTGGDLKHLEPYGEVTAFDFYDKAAEMYATRQRGRIAIASTDAIPFADATFDLVTSFDVICQLDAPADETALRELTRVLKPGGVFFVRVPAFQVLHGPHDQNLHTYHRYTTGELAQKMRRAGLELLETTYSNTILFPVALVRRLLSKLRPPRELSSDVRPVPAPLNVALTAVLSTEARIISKTRLPFGLSAIAMGRKP
jgi:SAM-dependent methyltransferase